MSHLPRRSEGEQGPMDPVSTYRECAQATPPLITLEGIASSLNASNRLHIVTVAADVALDLAQADPSNRDQHLTTAHEKIEYVVGKARSWGDPRKVDEIDASAAVTAFLRQTELPGWFNALQGKPIVPQYGLFVTAAFEAARLNRHRKAEAKLAEIIPLLLESRALHNYGDGKNGRMSLDREDNGIFNNKDENPNWDISLADDTSAKQFLQASTRIDVTTQQGKLRGKRTSIRNASGIIVLRTSRLGAEHHRKVIQSCFAELNGRQQRHHFSTVELDEQTDELRSKIIEQKAKL